MMRRGRGLLVVLLLLNCASSPPAMRKLPEADIRAEINYRQMPPGQQAVIAVVVNVPSGYHVQSHTPLAKNLRPLIVSVEPTAGLEVFEPVYPPPVIREYPALGKLSVYEGRVVVYVPVQVKRDA